MGVGKEEHRARGEVLPSVQAVTVPRGEESDQYGDLSQASRSGEVDHEVRETPSCRH